MEVAKSGVGSPGVVDKAPDLAIFGKNDVTAEKLAVRRQVARGVSKELLEIAARKKRDELLARIEEQQEAEKMLQKNAVECAEMPLLPKFRIILRGNQLLIATLVHFNSCCFGVAADLMFYYSVSSINMFVSAAIS